MDIHTLHVEHAASLALYTILTIANSSLYRGMRGIQWFPLYSFFVFLGALSVALRGQVSDFASIVVGNISVTIGYLCLFLALASFLNRRTLQVYVQIFMVAVTSVTMLEYGWFHPNTSRRLVAYSIILCIQTAHIAFFIFRKRNVGLRIPLISMAVMVAGLALTNFLRTLAVIFHGVPENYLNAGTLLATILVITSCLQAGALVSYVWMTAASLRDQLQMQATTDALTGVLNRRGIEQAAELRITNCLRESAPLAALVIDLDGFKYINDTHGHHFGDAVLVTIAATLQRELRPGDILGRIGGDEFAILLPYATHSQASEIQARLRSAVGSTEIVYGHAQAHISGSFGMANLEPPLHNWEQLFLLCDKALYIEKEARHGSTRLQRLHPPDLGLQHNLRLHSQRSDL